MKIFSERSESEDFDEEAYQKSKRGERRQAYIFLILGGLVSWTAALQFRFL